MVFRGAGGICRPSAPRYSEWNRSNAVPSVKAYKETIIGIVFLIISVFYFRGTFIDQDIFMPSQYGPDFVPRIYLVAFVALSISLIISNVRKNRVNPQPRERLLVPKETVVRTTATILLLVVYVTALRTVGFIITSTLYVACQLMIIAPPNKRKPVVFALFAVLCSLAFYFIFQRFFYLTLPRGFLG